MEKLHRTWSREEAIHLEEEFHENGLHFELEGVQDKGEKDSYQNDAKISGKA